MPRLKHSDPNESVLDARVLSGFMGTMGLMVNPALLEQVTQLPVDDRFELMGALWDSLDSDDMPVTEAEARMLDERLAALAVNPDAGRPVANVIADLRRRLS
jgi:putative addiction module component (TIGR02574 family)